MHLTSILILNVVFLVTFVNGAPIFWEQQFNNNNNDGTQTFHQLHGG